MQEGKEASYEDYLRRVEARLKAKQTGNLQGQGTNYNPAGGKPGAGSGKTKQVTQRAQNMPGPSGWTDKVLRALRGSK